MINIKYQKVKALMHIAFVFIVVIISGFVCPVDAAPLKAGVAKVNITNMEAGGVVKDSVYARVLVLDDGITQAVIISADVMGTGFFIEQVREQLQKDLKIKPENVIINSSHIHTNRSMCTDIDKRIVSAVKEAWKKTYPVNIGVGSGYEARIQENRRIRLKNGKEWTIRHANPLPPDNEVAGIGPVDPEIGILRVDRKDGRNLAVIYNFACHPYQDSWRSIKTGTTADYPGYASRVIEENISQGAVAMFIQGCGGNITTVLYKDNNQPRDSEPMGNMLGISTLKALKNIKSTPGAKLKIISEVIELPRRTDLQRRIEELQAEQQKLLHSLMNTSLNFKSFLPLYIKYNLNDEYPSYYSHRYLREEEYGNNDLENMDLMNRRYMEKYLANIYAMEKLGRLEVNLSVLRQQQEIIERVKEKTVKAEIAGIRIGDFVMVTFPGEAVVEIGLNIKKMSPYEHTFIAGYTNERSDEGQPLMEEGNIGYAPTAEHFRGEAYEDCTTILAPEWQKIYEEKVMEILSKL